MNQLDLKLCVVYEENGINRLVDLYGNILNYIYMNEIDKKLYLLFSDKTLSEGCMIKLKDFPDNGIVTEYSLSKEDSKFDCITYLMHGYINTEFRKNIEILGHEPQLHDVFKLAGEKCFGWNMSDWGLDITFHCEGRNFPPIRGYDPTLPLLKQSDETKQDIINLFTS